MEHILRNHFKCDIHLLVELHETLRYQQEYLAERIQWRNFVDEHTSSFTFNDNIKELLYQLQLDPNCPLQQALYLTSSEQGLIERYIFLDQKVTFKINSDENEIMIYFAQWNSNSWLPIYKRPTIMASSGSTKNICQSCVNHNPNQLAHMEPGGCLFLSYLNFSSREFEACDEIAYLNDKNVEILSNILTLHSDYLPKFLLILIKLGEMFQVKPNPFSDPSTLDKNKTVIGDSERSGHNNTICSPKQSQTSFVDSRS